MKGREFKDVMYDGLAKLMKALANPARLEIIAYCRGPFCVLADEAVKVLFENGFKVRRLDEGYPEWKMRQLESNQSS